MIGAQNVSTPPYSTPTSPTAALHDQNLNFQHTQNKPVPCHQGRFTKFVKLFPHNQIRAENLLTYREFNLQDV